jgi:hypothetical protein
VYGSGWEGCASLWGRNVTAIVGDGWCRMRCRETGCARRQRSRQGQTQQSKSEFEGAVATATSFCRESRSSGEPRSFEGFGGPEKCFPSLVIGPACPTIPGVGGRGKRLRAGPLEKEKRSVVHRIQVDSVPNRHLYACEAPVYSLRVWLPPDCSSCTAAATASLLQQRLRELPWAVCVGTRLRIGRGIVCSMQMSVVHGNESQRTG